MFAERGQGHQIGTDSSLGLLQSDQNYVWVLVFFFFIKPAAFTALGALCCLGVQSTAKIHSVAVLGGAGGADALSLCF